MRGSLAVLALAALAGATLWSGQATAQPATEVVAPEVEKMIEEDPDAIPEGWHFGLQLGTTISFSFNDKVVGSQDGSSFQFGLVFNGSAGLYTKEHRWLNELGIQETISKTPTIDSFLKTQDRLDFASTYFYRPPAIPWLGPFGRFRITTSIFPGYDVRDTDVNLWKGGMGVDGEGNPVRTFEPVAAQKKIDLTGWFEPLQLKQSAGVFAIPVEKEAVSLRLQLAVGAQQTLTQGGYVLADDDTTPEIELSKLEDYYQVGGEFEVAVKGAVSEYVFWGFGVNLFQPFYSSIDRGMSGFDLINVTLDAKVSVKIASWLSLDNVLSVKKLPLIVDEWQVQNMLLLTAGFNWEHKPE